MMDKSFGHYDVTGKIGEGGMGQVYSATDSRLQRKVALKVLPEAMVADPERLQRFEREAQLLASLNHPNIATLHGIEEVDGQIALVMELIEGEDLTERIKRGPIPPEDAARIAKAIAGALESAHDKGIIHRDLKPGNVKLGKDGAVKVLDFGLAKAMEGARSPGQQDLTNSPTISLVATQQGIILGTAAYMSPEQAAGQDLDRRCDIWSFGVVFYEMLTGARPFEGETLSHTLADVLRGQIDWDRLPVDTPARLRHLLVRCLERDPRRRMRDMGEARIALEDWLAAPAPIPEAVASAPPAVTGWRARLPWALVGVSSLVALGALGLLLRPEPVVETTPTRFKVELGYGAMYASVGSGTVLSADGSALAFVMGSSAGDDNQILLRPLDQLESRVLAEEASGATNVYNPFFSPDGDWLGYVSPNALYKVRTSGGSAMTLTEVSRSRGAAWGPSGVIVVAAGPGEGLSVVPAAGGKKVPLTTLNEEAGEKSHRWPAFLPDGRNVLFSSLGAGSDWNDAVLEIVDIETKERREIFRGGTNGRVLPSGHLVYASSSSLFALPFDLKRLETYGSAAPVLEGVGTSAEGGAHYSIADNGTLVYLGGANQLPEYPIARISARGAREIIWSRPGTYAAPRVSPDGRRLAISRELGGNWDVWVLDLERGSETRLTFSESADTESIWSPDGEFIVWSSTRDDGLDALYRKRADGSGEIERLSESTDIDLYATDWSKDGRYLAISAANGRGDIVTLDLEGDGSTETFLQTEFGETAGAFSPDGRWMAYSSNESGVTEVYVRPFPVSGGKWQISTEGGANPRWSSDGRHIFYRGETQMMQAEVDGRGASFSAERPVVMMEANFQGGLGGINLGAYTFAAFDFSPDGSLIVFPQDSSGNSLDHATFVLHWTDELERMVPTDR